MKRLTFLLFGLFLISTFACTKYIVRDSTTYQTELNQYDAWATKQASLLRGFMAKSCTCNTDKKFVGEMAATCAKAADFVLTIEARHEWHKAMSLYLAGITDDRPSETPPEIPPSSTLCPAMEGE